MKYSELDLSKPIDEQCNSIQFETMDEWRAFKQKFETFLYETKYRFDERILFLQLIT